MAKPLLNIHCETKPYCKYPVAVKIPMNNGTVQTYVWQETKKETPTKGNCEHPKKC